MLGGVIHHFDPLFIFFRNRLMSLRYLKVEIFIPEKPRRPSHSPLSNNQMTGMLIRLFI